MNDDRNQVCGTARAEGERIHAGQGDPLLGQLILSQRALDRARVSHPPGAPALVAALLGVCRALSTLHRQAEVEPLAAEVASILGAGPQDDAAAQGYGDTADALRERNPSLAAKLYERALAMTEQPASRVDTFYRIYWRKGRAETLLSAGRTAEAEDCYRQAVALDRAVPHPPQSGYRGTVLLLIELARTCLLLGRLAQAHDAIEEGLAESHQQSGPGSNEEADLLSLRGEVHRLRGAPDRARPDEFQAIAIYRAILRRLTALGPRTETIARFEGLIAALEARS
jgi:tetratricopeptide (TPR) repeat protein